MQSLDQAGKRRIDALRTRHDHGARATKRRRRLTKPAQRQQRAVDGGPARVDQHQVEIPSHLSMLEAVVQHQRVDLGMVGSKPLDGDPPLRAHGDRRLRHLRAMLERLVGRLAATMTTHHDRRRPARRTQFAADPSHHG